MLQFWKNSGVNKSLSPPPCTNPETIDSSNSTLKPIDDNVFEDNAVKERSRLCKSLQDVLSDSGPIGYFMQYMEAKDATCYLQCWLDISAFKFDLQRFKDKKGDDSLSVSTDCDSCSADTNSLNDCSADTISESHDDMSDTSPKMKNSTEENDKKNLVDNALNIFKKYIAQEATHNINCSNVARNDIIENICDADKLLTSDCFDHVQTYVFELMDKEYFEAFHGSDYFCKHQIDVLTSGNVVLEDILHNETALFYFMEFLEQENSSNLLEFWIAATNLQQHLHEQKQFLDLVEAQNDAVVLYDKYFSLQALCPLGFGDGVRFELEQNICGEHGLVIDCFNVPLKIAEQVFEKKYLKSFLASQLFYKYLSELISTVQSNDYTENKSLSDCSSERSVFLAMKINSGNAKKSTDMNIDSRLLCDPDSLWQRKRNHRLSCGRITTLGKFETDLEPVEPEKNGFRLKNVVKKFVNLNEDKKKEEMAWQVAEMIVKDITDITLSQDKAGNS